MPGPFPLLGPGQPGPLCVLPSVAARFGTKSPRAAHHSRTPCRDLPAVANQPPPPPPADGPISRARVDRSARRRGSAAKWDGKIAWIAARQKGLISLDQLRTLGIERATVQRRVSLGALHAVHRGVYTVGHPLLERRGRFLAAVLACGPGAVLSHRSAAELWGMGTWLGRPIDVTAPGRRGRNPEGIDAHRHGSLIPADRTVVHGIPCTTVSRTLLDLAGVVSLGELRQALAQAEVERVLDFGALRRQIDRGRGRRGVARLRLLLDELDPATKRTRSELERRFLHLCRRAGLPPPEVNVMLDLGDARFMPDFLWRQERLIIELDGRRYHDTNSAYESDRRREQRLQLAGWRVSSCTWSQVVNEPRELAATVRGLLAQAS